MNNDTRWEQRFQNFENAFLRLKEAMDDNDLNELERNGLEWRFKITLGSSWKVMKDFLVERGFAFEPAPKDTIWLAAQSGYIDYAQALIDGLEIRNELSHDYSGNKFETMELQLRQDVYPALEKLYYFFKEQLKNPIVI